MIRFYSYICSMDMENFEQILDHNISLLFATDTHWDGILTNYDKQLSNINILASYLIEGAG